MRPTAVPSRSTRAISGGSWSSPGSGFGAFVFPSEVLASRGVVAVDGAGGKRGFRVYPPWSEVTSPQAATTQRWQCASFLPLTDDAPGALDAARRLF